MKFLCEEAQKAIKDSEVAAASPREELRGSQSGFGSSSSSDVSSSSDADDDDDDDDDKVDGQKKSKLKFRKRADAAIFDWSVHCEAR